MEKTPKLELIQMIGMTGLALVCDAITLIPFSGWIVTSIFWTSLSIYLWLKGFGFLNTRRLATMAISLVIGWIPILEALPELIVGTSVVIAFMKVQEKTGISVTSIASGKISAGQAAHVYHQGRGEPRGSSGKPPLNQGDSRLPTEA